MNLLDLGIIVLLGLITVRGFFRGLFQEVAVLVGVVGGVVVAAHTYLRLASLLQPWITDPQACPVGHLCHRVRGRLLAHATGGPFYPPPALPSLPGFC